MIAGGNVHDHSSLRSERPRPALFAASEPLMAILGADCGAAAPKKFAGISSKAVVKLSLVMNRILVFRYFQSDQSCFNRPSELRPNQSFVLQRQVGRTQQRYLGRAAYGQKCECLLTREYL